MYLISNLNYLIFDDRHPWNVNIEMSMCDEKFAFFKKSGKSLNFEVKNVRYLFKKNFIRKIFRESWETKRVRTGAVVPKHME